MHLYPDSLSSILHFGATFCAFIVGIVANLFWVDKINQHQFLTSLFLYCTPLAIDFGLMKRNTKQGKIVQVLSCFYMFILAVWALGAVGGSDKHTFSAATINWIFGLVLFALCYQFIDLAIQFYNEIPRKDKPDRDSISDVRAEAFTHKALEGNLGKVHKKSGEA